MRIPDERPFTDVMADDLRRAIIASISDERSRAEETFAELPNPPDLIADAVLLRAVIAHLRELPRYSDTSKLASRSNDLPLGAVAVMIHFVERAREMMRVAPPETLPSTLPTLLAFWVIGPLEQALARAEGDHPNR